LPLVQQIPLHGRHNCYRCVCPGRARQTCQAGGGVRVSTLPMASGRMAAGVRGQEISATKSRSACSLPLFMSPARCRARWRRPRGQGSGMSASADTGWAGILAACAGDNPAACTNASRLARRPRQNRTSSAMSAGSKIAVAPCRQAGVRVAPRWYHEDDERGRSRPGPPATRHLALGRHARLRAIPASRSRVLATGKPIGAPHGRPPDG
jgi:hypothetical protein